MRKDCAALILCTAESHLDGGRGVQILGGNGYINEYPVGRLWRDAKLYEIGAAPAKSAAC